MAKQNDVAALPHYDQFQAVLQIVRNVVGQIRTLDLRKSTR
jgi:hypothetical protein